MSAYLDETLERWAYEAGAFAFVGKAASFDRIHRLLMQATGRDATPLPTLAVACRRCPPTRARW